MRYALIIGNDQYSDPKLARLRTPTADVWALAEVLGNRQIGAFDEVEPLENLEGKPAGIAISKFLANKKSDDLVLVYFSGHGVLDSRGRLYLAFTDTQTELLSATALPSTFIVEALEDCRSRRQILILDCCHAGAFERGTKGDQKVMTAATFEGSGSGRVVLTASDETQWALEGDQVIQTHLSLFTHFLVEGLKTGSAAPAGHEQITLDEWYDYAYSKVVSETSKQKPRKWSYRQEGDLIIARNPGAGRRTAGLDARLLEALESPFPGVREAAVNELGRILVSKDRGLARQAGVQLERLREDDSRSVAAAAERLLSAGGKPAETQSKPIQPATPTPTRAEKNSPHPEIEAALLKGDAKFKQGRCEEAISEYSKAIKIDPKYAPAYEKRGCARMINSQSELAIVDLTKAIELDPSFAEAYQSRGSAHYFLKQFHEALVDYSRAIELCPEEAGYYRARSQAYQALGRHTEAIADVETWHRLSGKPLPDGKTRMPATEIPSEQVREAERHFRLGEDRAKVQQYDPAISAYSRAIELNPQHSQAYIRRGDARFALEKYGKAVNDYSLAIGIEPANVEAYNKRGNAYAAQEQESEAQDDYSKASQLDPSDPWAYNNRGLLYMRRQYYSQALSEFSRAIQLNPRMAETYCNRGRAQLALKQYTEALADFSKAIELDPKLVLAYNKRGLTYDLLKRYDAAILDYSKAIQVDPQASDAYLYRSQTYRATGRNAEAQADMRKYEALTKGTGSKT